MSGNWKGGIARRALLAALGTLAGIGAVGGALYEGGILGVGQKSDTYNDILAGLQDCADAAKVGKAVLAGDPQFQTDHAARALQEKVGKQPISKVLTQDAVQGRIVEIQGWVLPQTLAELCALAAHAS